MFPVFRSCILTTSVLMFLSLVRKIIVKLVYCRLISKTMSRNFNCYLLNGKLVFAQRNVYLGNGIKFLFVGKVGIVTVAASIG